jgi:hypothetical protein
MTRPIAKPVTYVARIHTSLSFGELAAGLAELGDVENLFIKDSEHVANGETAAARYKTKRTYSADGLQKLRETNTRRAQERIERIVATFADILRANAHAPMVKLVALMNATDVRPNPRGQPWSEQSLTRHLDAALARVTDPDGPQVSG